MNGRYGSDDLEDVHESTPAADREISLGTGAMLGIFLALVLVCGAFFGLGYSMGHKAAPVGTRAGGALADADAGGTGTAADGELKPAPGSSITESPDLVVAKPSAAATGTRPATAAAAPRPRTPESTEATEPEPVPRPAKPYVTPPATAAPSTATATATPLPAANGASSAPVYVQISAVSHQEDAQLLLTALKRRGYDATVRHTLQDPLLHVQVGPFATKKEADTMKQRLSADGYNAILK